MYFPVAGIDVNPLVPPVVAFVISFFTSMGGVSGAFLLLPFQMSFLGYTSPSVSATNQLFNIVAIPSGVYRYVKEGRMVWPLTWVVIIGTLPGVLIGALIRVKYLPDPRNFKFFVGLVLLYIGLRMVQDMLRATSGDKKLSAEDEFQRLVRGFKANAEGQGLPSTKVVEFSPTRISYDFYGRNFTIKTGYVLALSALVGIVGGVYGIGGGSIMAPFFISFLGLPVYTVAGAALMGTFVTSVAGVIFYQAIAPFYPNMAVAPDWLLGFLFGIGGTFGMYLGARVQKHMPAKAIKAILCACIFFVAGKYIWNFFR
ncbi:MAG: sulfite exporter TauE/SafE family protein [Thermodesulfobacteria bacterium]|nr:sulfite exporter TauE/SafE family protein [Thermodesulfobacteriota bacterium]